MERLCPSRGQLRQDRAPPETKHFLLENAPQRPRVMKLIEGLLSANCTFLNMSPQSPPVPTTYSGFFSLSSSPKFRPDRYWSLYWRDNRADMPVHLATHRVNSTLRRRLRRRGRVAIHGMELPVRCLAWPVPNVQYWQQFSATHRTPRHRRFRASRHPPHEPPLREKVGVSKILNQCMTRDGVYHVHRARGRL